VGFADIRVVEHYDCFRGTTKERTAQKYGVLGATVSARRP